MLFSSRFWPGIENGSITVTFRRWRRPQAVAGREYRTPAGRIRVDTCAIVDPGLIDEAEASRAGFESAEALRRELRGGPSIPVYRVAFHRLDAPDPRDVLAEAADLAPAELVALAGQFARLDAASGDGPWTYATLLVIAAHPGRRAHDLAELVGRDTMAFKAGVRKLRARGLTISLETGYRLSSRGEAFIAWQGAADPNALIRSPS